MARFMSALVVLAVIAMAVPSAQAWGSIVLNTGCPSGRCGCSTSNGNAASSYCTSQPLPAGSTCTSIIDKICKQMDFITYYSTSVINNIKVNIDVVAKSDVDLTPNSAVATVTTGGQAIANGPGAATTFTSDSGTETNVGPSFSSSVGGSTVSASSQITPTTIATCPTSPICSPACTGGKTCTCTITNNAPVNSCAYGWGRRLAA